MPLFEFHCHNCNKSFDFWHVSYKNLHETTCPDCKGKDVKRIYTPNRIDMNGVVLMNEKKKREFWSLDQKGIR